MSYAPNESATVIALVEAATTPTAPTATAATLITTTAATATTAQKHPLLPFNETWLTWCHNACLEKL